MSDPQSPAAAPVADDEVLFFRRVLVPLDFSEHARKALRHARGLARQYRGRLLLLHVVEPMACPSDLGYTPVITDEMVEEIRREAGARLEEEVAREKAAAIECEGLLRFGRPYLEITEAADDAGVDLIVLTTHGYTGLKHVLLGSTAERVVRHARCPVLVVRDKEGSAAPSPGAPATAG